MNPLQKALPRGLWARAQIALTVDQGLGLSDHHLALYANKLVHHFRHQL